MNRMIRAMLGTLCLVGLATLSRASEPVAKIDASTERLWTTTRDSFDGPTLDAAWFAKRRTVVYLVPDSQMGLFRRVAGAVMRDRWTSGDWSLKHVFISAAEGKAKFVAGQRLGLRDTALEITRAAGQPEDFVETTEAFVRQHVFFVHDPDGAVWRELLGDSKRRPAAVLLDYGGKVVKVLELDGAAESESKGREAGERLATEVRTRLTVRPELGG